ncbi:peptidase domain-containing ABC transporter [Cognatiyoonia sp. IB215446]|uniref:peptidase domain-containing ABC transporter n=1 Tax=Cognatiyoonia sp. IB215446 TaxID=3097355 RepID=UPI002A118493|nr:peptidase domain-containing ABC transporter [Cognatiyoonia sp. IB215446]MDX8346920.1 peptidase domain-containing ABC transporter [Cognatiyoonia sp. IB215446]
MVVQLFKSRLPLIRQDVVSECGLACLAMVAAHNDRPIALRTLRALYPSSNRGTSLRDILKIAREIGLKPRMMRLEPGQVRRHKDCLLLHWNFDHYVIFAGMRGARYHILDPAKGAVDISANDFDCSFTGVAVGFTPASDQMKLPPTGPRPSLRQIWPKFAGQNVVVTLIVCTSILLQAVQMAVPLLTAYIVDVAIPSTSGLLLSGTVFGMFSLLLVAAICRIMLRGVLIEYSQRVSRLMVSSLFDRLIRLPVAWFHARDTGQILSRVTSSSQVQELAVARGIPAVADCIIFLPGLVMLTVLSPAIGATVLFALILIAIIHCIAGHYQRLVEADRLHARAEANGAAIELVSRIDSVRIRNAEAQSFGAWSGRFVEMLQTERRFERGERASDGAIEIVLTLTMPIVVWIGAKSVMAGNLTVGTLLAILIILGLMTAALQRMATFLRQIHAVTSHVDNISSILEEEPDPDAFDTVGSGVLSKNADGLSLRFDCVSYRHSGAHEMALTNINLEITPGETIGVIGVSGAGKSTLVSLITGLKFPTDGQIFVDDVPLTPGRGRALRNRIGVVLQNDDLFRGSVADNICSFADFPDNDRIAEVAHLAAIDTEIEALPLGYHTPIGDGGAQLSGGQTQRIMIARALYHEPELLILDEGTANLNVELEEQIHRNLSAKREMSRLIITHRPQVLTNWADRILEVRQGRLIGGSLKEAAE